MTRELKVTVVTAEKTAPAAFRADVLIVPFFKNSSSLPAPIASLDKTLGNAIGKILKLGDFSAATNELVLIYAPDHAVCPRVLLTGLGEKNKFDLDILRQAVGTAVRAIDRMAAVKAGFVLPADLIADSPETVAQALAEGAVVGRYDIEDYLSAAANGKSPARRMTLTVLVESANALKGITSGLHAGSAVAEGQNLARMIANKPANEISPPVLAQWAKIIARQYNLKCKVFDDKDLTRMKMNAILAVGNGSAEKPRFIVLEHDGRKSKTKNAPPDLVVVGKAVTFDSGGIDLKPAPKMELMKFDKSGGCAVLGIMAAAAKMKLPLRVIGLIPSAENLLSSTCWRPGDIVTTHSGKTVEILSTDAEGRMLLADAMSYAAQFKPRTMIDLATLTGACAVALGEGYAGLFVNDDQIRARLQAAGETSGERVWHMPSGPEYLEQMKSKVADLKNVGTREGGACAAAAFLGEFAKDIPWAHVDIACVAKPDTDKPWRNSGATGFGVRLILEFLRMLK